MRALFFGSPAFAVPCLDALATVAEVACVFTQPDKPAGRGLALTPPEVKSRALALGLRVEQPTKVRTPEFAELVRSFESDVALVVAYGRILPKAVLDAPRVGCINVHGSLLPHWRGAAPIQWSVAAGDVETGVTLMQMDEGLDTGPMIAVLKTSIGENETAGELAVRMAELGAELVRTKLADAVRGALPRVPQPAGELPYARLLEKTDGVLDFTKSAYSVHAVARGMTPWPGAQTRLGAETIKVHGTRIVERGGSHGAPGAVLAIDERGVVVACGEGSLALVELQQPGKKRVSGADFAKGARLSPGSRLGGEP